MPPLFIADSDEEDETYSPDRHPAVTSIDPHEEATQPFEEGPYYHATSTDPSFFQNIYDEQNCTFQDGLNGGLSELVSRDPITSSEVTAPAPFQRTVTGLIDPSSLTSVSDPTNVVNTKTSSGKGVSDWTQVSTPGRKKAPTAVMDDPWDVPSSPEVSHNRIAPKIRLKKKETAVNSKKVSKKTPAVYQHAASALHEVEANYDVVEGQEISPSGRRKRRKIETTRPTQASSDEVDLVAIPFSNDYNNAPSSMLPPTLPMDHNPSFYISTKPLTDTERGEYQSVHLSSSGGRPESFLLPICQQDMQMMGFSGTPTNVNTPRSEKIGFSTAPTPSESTEVDAAIETAEQPSPPRLQSSPDIISLTESPPKPKSRKQRSQPRHAKSPSPIRDQGSVDKTSAVDGWPNETEPPPMEPATYEQDSEYIEQQQTKPKKSRGRPRKKDNEEAASTSNEPTINPEDEGMSTKKKKKRGRPRKQDKPVAAEEKPPNTVVTPEHGQYIDGDTSQDTPETKDIKGKKNSERENKVKEAVEGLPPTDDTESAPEITMLEEVKELKEISRNSAVSNPVASDKEPKLNKSNDSDAKKEDKALRSATKNTAPAKGLSALIGKPMYRVGLSKRSRIAPLLKSVRK